MISFSITRIILTLRLSMTLLRYFISQAYLVYRLLFSAQYGTVLINHYYSISPSNVFLFPILFKFVIFRTYQFQNRNCRVVDQSSGMIKGSVPPSFVTRL